VTHWSTTDSLSCCSESLSQSHSFACTLCCASNRKHVLTSVLVFKER
jgi:hypothetical protein